MTKYLSGNQNSKNQSKNMSRINKNWMIKIKFLEKTYRKLKNNTLNLLNQMIF